MPTAIDTEGWGGIGVLPHGPCTAQPALLLGIFIQKGHFSE